MSDMHRGPPDLSGLSPWAPELAQTFVTLAFFALVTVGLVIFQQRRSAHALDALRAHGHDMASALQYAFGGLILLQVAGLLPLLWRPRKPDAHE